MCIQSHSNAANANPAGASTVLTQSSTMGACAPPESAPGKEEPLSAVAGMQSPQHTAAQIPSLPQGTVHTETEKLALLWAYGPAAPRPSYCLVELPFQEENAKEVQLDFKSLRPPDLHIVERNNRFTLEVTGRFIRHGRSKTCLQPGTVTLSQNGRGSRCTKLKGDSSGRIVSRHNWMGQTMESHFCLTQTTAS